MTTAEQHREYARRWRERHPERYKANKARWTAANKDKVRAMNLRNAHGITLEQYNAMFAAQKGICAVCGLPETKVHKAGTPMSLAVDHDHTSGMIRALLCSDCNRALGLFHEDPIRMELLATYIRKHKGVKG